MYPLENPLKVHWNYIVYHSRSFSLCFTYHSSNLAWFTLVVSIFVSIFFSIKNYLFFLLKISHIYVVRNAEQEYQSFWGVSMEASYAISKEERTWFIGFFLGSVVNWNLDEQAGNFANFLLFFPSSFLPSLLPSFLASFLTIYLFT